MKRQFTTDLAEREQIFRSAIVLERYVFDFTKTMYRPPTTSDSFPAPNPDDSIAIVTKFENAFVNYNLRLADIATAIDPVIESALCDAGLDDTDRKLWALHKSYAEQVRSDPVQVPENTGLLFVPDMCPFSFAPQDRSSKTVPMPPGKRQTQPKASSNDDSREIETRLDYAAKLITRLAASLKRILSTVDRRAVTQRVHVDVREKRILIDGVEYKRLNTYSLRFFSHLARAGGHYVASSAIAADSRSAKIPGKAQFRTERVKSELLKKHPKLLDLLEIKDGVGSRLILPLPIE